MAIIKPVKASPLLRGLKNIVGRFSGAEQARQALKEAQRVNLALSDSITSAENRLIEATRQLKTGIAMGWGFQSKDFSQASINKIQSLAFQAYHGHPLAKKAVKTKRSLVCQEGFKLEAIYDGEGRDGMTKEQIRDRVQDFLDQHWQINWEDRLEVRTDSKIIYGETAFWLPPPNRMSGQSQAGMICRERIQELLPDPLNAERAGVLKLDYPLGFVVEGEKKMRDELPLVRYCWRDQEFKGEVLYWGSNRLDTMYRGISDLSPVLDYLDVFDQLVWTEAERVKMQRSILFHYVMKGADPDTILKKQKELSMRPPAPGSFPVTNENVEIREIVPNLNTQPSLDFIKFIFGLASGCLDLPEHWFYAAESVNKASGQEMTAPIFAGVRDEKRDLSRVLYTQHAYALQRASRVEGSLVYGFTADELAFEVRSRDPERDAIDVIGSHLLSLSQALLVIKAEGWMNDDQCGRLIRTEASALGLGEIEAPEQETPDAAVTNALSKLERIRKINGKSEKFPLALEGDPNWSVKRPA